MINELKTFSKDEMKVSVPVINTVITSYGLFEILECDNDKLFIGGLDTYSYDKADIDKVMNYFNDNDDINYKIILVHEPDYIDTITSKKVDT